jgi:hypothetical protein
MRKTSLNYYRKFVTKILIRVVNLFRLDFNANQSKINVDSAAALCAEE